MEYIRTGEREYPVSDALTLEFDGRSGNILVEGGDGDRARVQFVAHIYAEDAVEADTTLQRIAEGVSYEDGVLRITPPRVAATGLFQLFNRGLRIDYAVTVPRNTRCRLSNGSGRVEVARIAGPLDISQKSGRTTVRLIEGDARVMSKSGSTDVEKVGGSLIAQSQSGRISADGVGGDAKLACQSGSIKVEQIGGNLLAQTHSGRIDADNVGGSVQASTHSGAIKLAGVRGSLNAQTGSGAIHFTGQALGNITIATGSGSIHFDVDPSRPFFMDAETGSGSIRSDLRPRKGDGPPPEDAPRVNLRSGSGSIRIGPRRAMGIAIQIDKEFDVKINPDLDIELDNDIGERVARQIEEHMERARERMERHAERAQRHAERAQRHAEREAERAQRRAERQAERARRRAAGEPVGDDEDDEDEDDLL